MSEWNYEKHFLARRASGEAAVGLGGDVCKRAAGYLDDALDEIERLRGLADDPAAVDIVARELCDSARLPGVWEMTDEFDRDSFRKGASSLLHAALNPEGGARIEAGRIGAGDVEFGRIRVGRSDGEIATDPEDGEQA